MHFTKSAVIGFLPAALAANFQVIVGANNGLTFTPNTVKAAVGDTVQYMFATQNHTVTSGNAAVGCTPNNNFNSGFVPAPGAAGTAAAGTTAAGAAAGTAKGKKPGQKLAIRGENSFFIRAGTLPSFTVPVTSTQPVTVYCAQAQHCQSGMVMVINPAPAGAQSLQQYQATCAKAKTNVPAKAVTGGTLKNLVKPAAGGAGAAAGTTGTGAAAAGTTGTGAAAGTAKGKAKGKGKKAKKAKAKRAAK